MHIICLTPVETGVYNDHNAPRITLPPAGWAYIPEGFALPSTFPRLGSVEAEEVMYTREILVEKEVTKTRQVEKVQPVVKVREIPVKDEEGNYLLDENGEPILVEEEYTEYETIVVTEEYTEIDTVAEEQEYTMLTVTHMTEGKLPEPETEPCVPVEEDDVWDELAAALQEGVDSI